MAHEAQESADARGFLEQPGLVVACGAVGLVGEQQAAEVAFGALLASGCSTTKTIATTGWRRPVVKTIDPL